MSAMVNCTARFFEYVSNVLANGIPVGDDLAGDGSPANPWLTLNRARTVVPAAGQIRLNGDPAAPAVYSDGASTFTATVSIAAVVALGAVLVGNNATQAITIQPSGTGQTFVFKDLIIDPSLNVGGPAARCVTLAANAVYPTPPNITFDGVKFQNWSSYCMTTDLALRMGTLTLNNINMQGGAVNGGIVLTPTVGSLVVNGGTATVTALNTQNTGGALHWNAQATGVTASVANFSSTVTLSSALSSGLYFANRLLNCAGMVWDGGTQQILGAPGTCTGAALSFEASLAGTPIDNGIVRNGTFINQTNGGYCLKVGEEGPGVQPVANNMLIDHCQAVGNTTSAEGAAHGFFLGCTSNSTMQNSTATNVGLIGTKESTNVSILNMVVNGYAADGIVLKSTTGGSVFGNQVTQTGSYDITTALFIEENVVTGTPSTGINVAGNIFTINGGTRGSFVVLDTFGSTFTPTHNSYILSSGTLVTNPFSIAGVNYASCGPYRAAVEPTANCSPI